MLGFIGIPMSIGPIVGPLLGGVIYARGGYYAVFGLVFAMLGVDAMLRLIMVEKSVAQTWLDAGAAQSDKVDDRSKSDLPANQTRCPKSSEISHTTTDNSDKATQGASPSSHFWEHPFPAEVRLLLSFRMSVGLLGGLLQSSLNVALDSTLPLTVNALFGWQQTGQGLVFLTILLPSLLQPIFGAITDRYQQGRRLLAAGGCLLATPAYVLLRSVTQDTLSQKVLLCAFLVIIGLAMAIAMPAIIAEIGATVADVKKNNPQAIQGSLIATGWSLVDASYAAG